VFSVCTLGVGLSVVFEQDRRCGCVEILVLGVHVP